VGVSLALGGGKLPDEGSFLLLISSDDILYVLIAN